MIAALVTAYVGFSLLSAIINLVDKQRAKAGRFRVRERTLHLLDLCGGFPGGMLGRYLARHKTRKTSFRRVTWLIVGLHATGWTLAAAWRCGLLRMP